MNLTLSMRFEKHEIALKRSEQKCPFTTLVAKERKKTTCVASEIVKPCFPICALQKMEYFEAEEMDENTHTCVLVS